MKWPQTWTGISNFKTLVSFPIPAPSPVLQWRPSRQLQAQVPRPKGVLPHPGGDVEGPGHGGAAQGHDAADDDAEITHGNDEGRGLNL